MFVVVVNNVVVAVGGLYVVSMYMSLVGFCSYTLI